MSGWWTMGRSGAPRRARGPALAGALVIALAVAAPLSAGAQQTTVQPLQGQPTEQVQQDMAACQNSATQASGYSPSQAPVAAAPTGPSGKRLKGAAAGAAAGGVRAEARGNDSEAGDKVDDDRKQDYRQDEAQASARAGAAVGGMATRSDRRQGRREQGQQQQQASAWGQSYKSCLTSRGYAVTP
jgi:hypothetical protein